MRLFRLTAATLFRRKTWVIATFTVAVLPFLFTQISGATENGALTKPALAQATWAMTLVCSIFWGFFTAAKQGESNAKSGLGEYFLTTGISAGRQLFEMWLAIFSFLAPLPFISAIICVVMASPSQPAESAQWMVTNFQYALLFVMVMAPLVALACAVASRLGSITGFLASSGLAIYGFYGVGYLRLLGNGGDSALAKWLWTASPHYHFADPAERLRYKLGEIAWDKFPLLLAYFGGILLVYAALSRLLFRARATA